jgi:NAD+ kinase
MQSVGLVPNTDRPAAVELARRTAAALEDRGVTVRIPVGGAGAIGRPELAADDDCFGRGLELVIALGGDGTMLHAVALAYPHDVPTVGVNAGQLGYLTAFEPLELADALDGLLTGGYAVSNRTVVECTMHTVGGVTTAHGLNDVVLEKIDAGRIVRVEVAIAGQVFTTYAADGVIIATPTGTTAYTFSVRGPIVSPSADLLVLTPVSPHMLFDRSLVLARDEPLELRVCGERAVDVTIDGRLRGQLEPGDRVVCRIADRPARIVAPRDLLFHQILKAKFALPDR